MSHLRSNSKIFLSICLYKNSNVYVIALPAIYIIIWGCWYSVCNITSVCIKVLNIVCYVSLSEFQRGCWYQFVIKKSVHVFNQWTFYMLFIPVRISKWLLVSQFVIMPVHVLSYWTLCVIYPCQNIKDKDGKRAVDICMSVSSKTAGHEQVEQLIREAADRPVSNCLP